MKSCVIFDFDGVIADTEEYHFSGFNEALAGAAGQIGGPLSISHARYMESYVPYGDSDAFYHMLEDNRRPTDAPLISALIEAKSAIMEKALAAVTEALPGTREALTILDRLSVPRAICSSARTAEIRQVLRACGLLDQFELIVGIEDVSVSKPHPEGYAKAFAALSELHHGTLDIAAGMAIEDSAGGAAAARAAGLRVLGVATNLPLATIGEHTTWAVESLAAVTEADWRRWLGV